VKTRRFAKILLLSAGALLATAAQPVAAQTATARPAVIATSVSQGATHAAAVRLDSPVFRLMVPFRTQKDGSPWQGSNCGPATLGMILDGFGVTGQTTDDLRLRAHTYQGTVGWRTGTGLQHVAHVAEDFGIGTQGLYAPDGSYRYWEIADVVAELRQGHPVMPLVRLYLVPGYEGMSSRWGHYILLTGLAPDGFYFSDSLKTDAAPGTTGVISERQLATAIAGSHIPGQAVAFSGPRDLDVWLPGR